MAFFLRSNYFSAITIIQINASVLFLVPRQVLLSSILCAASRRVSSQEKKKKWEQNQSLQQKNYFLSIKNLLVEEPKIHTHTPSYKTQSRSSIQVNSQLLKTSGTKCRAQERPYQRTLQISTYILLVKGLVGRSHFFLEKAYPC